MVEQDSALGETAALAVHVVAVSVSEEESRLVVHDEEHLEIGGTAV